MNPQFATAKQMLEMQKAASETMISGMITFWNQAGMILDGLVGLPEEAKKALRQWVDMNRKGCEGLRENIKDGYSRLEKFFQATG